MNRYYIREDKDIVLKIENGETWVASRDLRYRWIKCSDIPTKEIKEKYDLKLDTSIGEEYVNLLKAYM